MPIVPSRSGSIHELVARLSSSRPTERDRAVARLTLLGARAISPLTASLAGASVPARLAAVEVLQEIPDPRALPVLESLASDPDPAVAARAAEALGERGEARSVPALAPGLARPRASVRRATLAALASLQRRGVVEALAPLLDALLDEASDPRLRLEILDVLAGLEPPLGRSTRQKLARRLGGATAPGLAERAAALAAGGPAPGRARTSDPLERLRAPRVTRGDAARAIADLQATRVSVSRAREALEAARAPEAVAALAHLLGERGDTASITILSRALERLAPGGRAGTAPALEARVAVHAALADLDSRIALHDLRDLVALHPRRVMAAVLEVVARCGDGSFVPALARAATDDPSLEEPCARAFAAIARRHRLRRTSPALRQVRREHRAVLDRFLAGARRR